VMADEFQDVDACWQRLVRRVNRISRGRTGPNIQQVQKMGATCEQIHTVLGMPGYPPTLIEAPHDHDHDHKGAIAPVPRISAEIARSSAREGLQSR